MVTLPGRCIPNPGILPPMTPHHPSISLPASNALILQMYPTSMQNVHQHAFLESTTTVPMTTHPSAAVDDDDQPQSHMSMLLEMLSTIITPDFTQQWDKFYTKFVRMHNCCHIDPPASSINDIEDDVAVPSQCGLHPAQSTVTSRPDPPLCTLSPDMTASPSTTCTAQKPICPQPMPLPECHMSIIPADDADHKQSQPNTKFSDFCNEFSDFYTEFHEFYDEFAQSKSC